eukprot:46015-Pleurochrysis_carterae.AAC.1
MAVPQWFCGWLPRRCAVTCALALRTGAMFRTEVLRAAFNWPTIFDENMHGTEGAAPHDPRCQQAIPPSKLGGSQKR